MKKRVLSFMLILALFCAFVPVAFAADAEEYNATGIRLYVNENNPIAHNLYTVCGFKGEDKAYFMEK